MKRNDYDSAIAYFMRLHREGKWSHEEGQMLSWFFDDPRELFLRLSEAEKNESREPEAAE